MNEQNVRNGGMTRRAFIGTAAAAAAAPAFARATSTDARLGVGVIGVGGRGQSHLHTLKNMAEAGEALKITAVCDVYRPRLSAAAERFEATPYMDYRELLADPAVDVVVIATPDHHHPQQAIDAARAGKGIYCEKPVSHWSQFELTKQLAQVVKESGVAFQLGTQGMSDGAWHQMKQLVKDGLIGQPIHAECGYFRVGDWGERGMPVDDPAAQPGDGLNWDAFLSGAADRPFDVSRFFRWRMYMDYAGGPVTDLYPHSLTPVMDILDAGMPKSVVATGGQMRYAEAPREVPDTFNLYAEFPGNFTIAVLGTQGNSYDATGHRGAPGRVPVVRGWDGSLTVEKDEIVFIPTEESRKKAERFPINQDEQIVNHYKNWLEAVRGGHQSTWSPVDLALRTQTVLQMAMIAYREGKTARFDPATEAIHT